MFLSVLGILKLLNAIYNGSPSMKQQTKIYLPRHYKILVKKYAQLYIVDNQVPYTKSMFVLLTIQIN